MMFVSTPMGLQVLAKHLVLECLLEFKENYLSINLIIFSMDDFDWIMGIDLLTKYIPTMYCYQWLVQFCPKETQVSSYGERPQPPMPVIFVLNVQHALEKGGECHLIYDIYTLKKKFWWHLEYFSGGWIFICIFKQSSRFISNERSVIWDWIVYRDHTFLQGTQ